MYDEIDYGELFGINEGGEGQGVTDPADTGEPQGGEGQEVAAPADDTDGEGSDGQSMTVPTEIDEGEVSSSDDGSEGDGSAVAGEGSEGDGSAVAGEGSDGAKPKQSVEENSRYAAIRRKAEAERDAAIARAREEAAATAKAEADKYIAETFEAAGLMNPYTGKPITDPKELSIYREAHDKARRSEFLKKAGVSEEELDAFISEDPRVKAAMAAEVNAAAAKRAADEAAARTKLEGELREISALAPEIRSLSDLTKHESYQRVYDLVKRGNSLIDAFKLANYDALTKGVASTVKRAAVNSVRSKDHMTATKTAGAGAVNVPREIMEEYRALMPDITDAEIRAHYRRNHK